MKKFWQRLVLFGLTGAFFVSCISCSAANTASKVPILMYHNLTNDPSAVTSMTITGASVFRRTWTIWNTTATRRCSRRI